MKKILVVDDEIDFLEMIRLRLQSNNYEVVTAMNGKEALEKVKTEKPDAVLLDILMPGADGIDTLKKMREHDERLPIFLITAYSNEERFKLANKYNASGFIIKTNDLQNEIANISAAINISEKFKGREKKKT